MSSGPGLPGNDSAREYGIPSERDRTAAPRPGVVVDQRDLVERAKQGDHDAFATLAGDAIARLDAAARLILRDPELARDGVQDGFIRAWRTLPALRDPDRFDAWLRRLVVHSCIDIMRRRRHRAIEVELTPIDGPTGVDFTSAIADRDLVDEALRHLDPEWRAVVVLHYFLGVPLPEVASMLGVPLGTAKSRLHRSLLAMRIAVGADETRLASSIPGGQPA
jgi:RNA polymerase sigma-70 factor, ECF subfamily